MEYSVEFRRNPDYNLITISGTMNRPTDSPVIQEVADAARAETDCTRFLIDATGASVTGSTHDTFNTAVAAAARGPGRDYRIAMAYSGDMSDHRFMEDVLVNRGFTARVFDNCKDAEAWLNQTKPATAV